jgi:hypothetical protein
MRRTRQRSGSAASAIGAEPYGPTGSPNRGTAPRLRPVQHVLFLDKHYSADTPRNAHGSLGSPDHPNRATEGDTSKVWPRANPRSEQVGVSGLAAAPQSTRLAATTTNAAAQQQRGCGRATQPRPQSHEASQRPQKPHKVPEHSS